MRVVSMIVVLVFVIGALLFVTPLLRTMYPLGYRDVILLEAPRRNLDPFFVAAIIQVESSFNPHAKSPKGATGLMQIMPDTGAWIASRMGVSFSPSDLLEPEKNIALGCFYLQHLFQIFPTEYAAVAAYNAGTGNVRGWLERGLWNGEFESLEDIPFQETRNYLRRVFHTWEFFRRLYGERFPLS